MLKFLWFLLLAPEHIPVLVFDEINKDEVTAQNIFQ